MNRIPIERRGPSDRAAQLRASTTETVTRRISTFLVTIAKESNGSYSSTLIPRFERADDVADLRGELPDRHGIGDILVNLDDQDLSLDADGLVAD